MNWLWHLVLLAAFSTAALAGPSSHELVFSDLSGISHRPLEPLAHKGSVLVFYVEDCPICNAYAPEINRLNSTYTNFAFYIVQVNPDLDLADAKKHAADYHLTPPVLLDPKHRLVAAVKATVTPEAFVINPHGEVVYHGRVDDQYQDLGKRQRIAKHHELISVLDALNTGKKIKVRNAPAVGCLIEPGN